MGSRDGDGCGSGGSVSLHRGAKCLQYGPLKTKILVTDLAFGIVSLRVKIWWRGVQDQIRECSNLCSGSCFCDTDDREIPHEDVRAAPSQPILEFSVVMYLQDVHIMYEDRVIGSRGNAKENENEILPIGPFPATR